MTLAPPDQAALDALEPFAYQLCAAAQHALGLAAIGSQMLRVRTGGGLLAFVGAGALWWVANTPTVALRVAIDRLLGEIRERSTAP